MISEEGWGVCSSREVVVGSDVSFGFGLWLFEPSLMEMCAIKCVQYNRIFLHILWNINRGKQPHPTQSLLNSCPRSSLHSSWDFSAKELNFRIFSVGWFGRLFLLKYCPKRDSFYFSFVTPCSASLGGMTKRWAALCGRVLQAWLLVLGTCGETREQCRSNGRLPSLPLGVYGPHQFEMSAWLEKLH